MSIIQLVVADITVLKVDVIVNAANESLLGGGGVDGAIHKAAGPELLSACKKLKGCSTGKAKITKGFKLPASYIIHTVGPIWQDGTHQEPELLRLCYLNSFELAHKYHLKSIAFPAISTGVYGFPKEQAATIALNAMKQNQLDFQMIIACLFSEQDKNLYQSILESFS